MKKFISITICVVFIFAFIGCGNPKKIDGIVYDTYGLINKDSKENENIEYEVIFGNIVWSVILSETIFMPIYFIGFSIMEPVGKIDPNNIKDKIN